MDTKISAEIDAKRRCVTSNVVAAALGSNPNMSRDDAMRRMVRDFYGSPIEGGSNMALDYALNNIDGALVEYGFETGYTTDRDVLEFADEWAAADVTAKALYGGQVVGGVIIVCPFNLRDAADPVTFRSGEGLERYIDRAQFFLWASGWSWVDIFQWCPADTNLMRVTACEAWQAENLPKLKAFWEEFCEERQQDKASRHLEPKRKIIDTPEAQRIMGEWDQLCEAIDNATARKAELLAEMVRIAGEKNAEFAGRNLTLTKRVGSIAYAKAIKELLPDADLEKWRGKPSESWGVK